MKHHEIISKDLLKAQHGKKVELTLENGGPIIGIGVFKYIEDEGLALDIEIDDLEMGAFLMSEWANSPKKES